MRWRRSSCCLFLWTSIVTATWGNNSVNTSACKNINILAVVFTKWKDVSQSWKGASRYWATLDRRIMGTTERDSASAEVSTIFRVFNCCPHCTCIKISIQVPEKQWIMINEQQLIILQKGPSCSHARVYVYGNVEWSLNSLNFWDSLKMLSESSTHPFIR